MNTKEPTKPTVKATLAFRWTYIALPLIILLLSIIATVYFYHLLPDNVAFQFQSDGSPDRWLSRGAIILIAILPQLFFTLLALVITWGITALATRFRESKNAGMKPESLLLVMGNMLVLPQLILCFAMLDIFSYNAYQVHLLPLWVSAVIIMVLGGIILGIFFARAMQSILRNTKEH